MFDLQATLELFGGNQKLMKEMLISFERLCSSRVLLRLRVSTPSCTTLYVALEWAEEPFRFRPCRGMGG